MELIESQPAEFNLQCSIVELENWSPRGSSEERVKLKGSEETKMKSETMWSTGGARTSGR